eukprot:1194927-Prorocentrum_minimum.AAC.5
MRTCVFGESCEQGGACLTSSSEKDGSLLADVACNLLVRWNRAGRRTVEHISRNSAFRRANPSADNRPCGLDSLCPLSALLGIKLQRSPALKLLCATASNCALAQLGVEAVRTKTRICVTAEVSIVAARSGPMTVRCKFEKKTLRKMSFLYEGLIA